MERFLCALSLLLLLNCALARDLNKLCQGVPDRSFVTEFSHCENYVTCVNGVAHAGSCPEPFFFNEATQACDHQRNVACKNCPSTHDTTMVNPQSKTCDSFVRCLDGEREFVKCPVGFMYDELIGRCNLITRAECFAATCTDNMDPSTFTFVPSKLNCRRYFICHQGTPTMRECAAGLKFNPVISGCDFEDNVLCTDNGPMVPMPNPLPEVVNVDCPANGMVFRPHPNNCRQAFLCVNGVPQLISCSEGLAWDDQENTCVPEQQTPCV